jgi:hypothetical protein
MGGGHGGGTGGRDPEALGARGGPPGEGGQVGGVPGGAERQHRRIVRWAGEVNPSLDALGASPIWVAEAPSSLGAALQVLDSTAEQLRDLESSMHDLLETEGRAVARGMAEYILTCFQSHDPTFQLTPVLVSPIRATAAAAQEGVQEAADMVVSRIRRRPEPAVSGDASGPPEQ